MARPLSLQDPYAVDRTPRVAITVSRKNLSGATVYFEEFRDVEEYCFDDDILSVTNCGSLTIGNPDGVHSGKIEMGDTVTFTMADPEVSGGKATLRLTGIITGCRYTAHGGGKILVQFADRGWHLDNNHAPLWMNLQSISFEILLRRLLLGWVRQGKTLSEVDNGWGFGEPNGVLRVAAENATNKRLNQGRAGIQQYMAQATSGGPLSFVAPIQAQPGQAISQIFVDYARREKKLVNVSSDGTLLFWQPNYLQDAEYQLEYHADAQRRRLNNCEDVSVEEKIDGLYTDVTCITQIVWPPYQNTAENPNADKVKGRYTNTGTLPFSRRATFCDGDQIGKAAVTKRAQWFWQRGIFDSWTYTAEVFGHSQNGLFLVPDSMVAVNDSVNKVQGKYYVGACRYYRKLGPTGGTRTQVRLHRAGFLSA